MIRFFRRKADEDVCFSVCANDCTAVVHLTLQDLRSLIGAADHFIAKTGDGQIKQFSPHGFVDLNRSFEIPA